MASTIKVPAEALDGAQSFAIDFGGSVLKVVYLKKNEVHPKGFKIVHKTSFARADFQKAIDFIKEECNITPLENGEPREYMLTGIGTHQFQEDLSKQLNIKVSTAWELECFKKAFTLLTNTLPEDELYHPPLYVEDESVEQLAKAISETIKVFGVGMAEPEEEKDENKEDKDTNKASNKWPCVMSMLGSAFVNMKFCEDGTTMRGQNSSRGGRMFLGLGGILTGAKTYQELMELAEKGNDRKVHCYTNDLAKEEEGESGSFYGKISKFDANAFSFGWCLGKSLDDFKPEDLARALLSDVVQSLVKDCMLTCDKYNVPNVVLVGGFAQAPLARKLIEEVFVKTAAITRMIDPKSVIGSVTCRTMKAGIHLGALGALLQSASSSNDEGQQDQPEVSRNGTDETVQNTKC